MPPLRERLKFVNWFRHIKPEEILKLLDEKEKLQQENEKLKERINYHLELNR